MARGPWGFLEWYLMTYAIVHSRTDEHTIKHMKINQKHEKNNTLFYLSSRRLFKTIIELVSFYERNDLGENFAG